MRGLSAAARVAIDRIVDAFDEPETLVDTVVRAALIPNTSPCVKWGPVNRFLVALAGTSDARGFRQWQEVGRSVRKGAKALHILVPRFRRIEPEDDSDEVREHLIGFVSAPVFAVEDTEGDPLPETVPPSIPRLQAVADALGIRIIYAGAVSDRVLGVYRGGPEDRITLYTHDVATYYHEVGHALHHRTGKLRSSHDAAARRDNEIVAEVSAAVLVRVFEGEEVGRQALGYIKDYQATKTRLLKLLPEIIEVVDLAVRIAASDRGVTEPIAACSGWSPSGELPSSPRRPDTNAID